MFAFSFLLVFEPSGPPYFTIASKYVTMLTKGPPLKPSDRAGLLAFADRLTDCENTLESIGRGVATCTQICNCVPENNNKKKINK